MRKENIGYHCWIVNLTNTHLSLTDVRVTLPPYSTMDILDYRHSSLTVQEVEKSLESGSLFTAQDKKRIRIRQSQPQALPEKTIELSQVSFPNKYRSSVVIEEKHYEELDLFINDEEFAEQNAEMSMLEHEPKINIKKSSNSEE